MIKHSFSIAKKSIENEKITTWLYSKCILHTVEIDDTFIEKNINKFNSLRTIWIKSNLNHINCCNLNYYGITIIPDSEINKFIQILEENKDSTTEIEIQKLTNMILKKNNDEILIHFGI